MKMSEPALCCDDCFHKIAVKNQKAANLWLQLCDLEKKHGLFGIKMNDSIAMQYLEQSKFILTTETKGVILVKVLNKQIDDEGEYFCRGDCDD